MRIKVTEFSPDAICEAMEDWGFEGDCEYQVGASEGRYYVRGGTYTFRCLPESGEVEISDLTLDLDSFLDTDDV